LGAAIAVTGLAVMNTHLEMKEYWAVQTELQRDSLSQPDWRYVLMTPWTGPGIGSEDYLLDGEGHSLKGRRNRHPGTILQAPEKPLR